MDDQNTSIFYNILYHYLLHITQNLSKEEPVMEVTTLDVSGTVAEETTWGSAGNGLVTLQPPLIPTPARVPVMKTPDVTLAPVDDVFINLGGCERCTMCGENVTNVKKLQEHYMNKHCAQPSQMLELLRMQQQVMNTILTNQTIHEQSMKILLVHKLPSSVTSNS